VHDAVGGVDVGGGDLRVVDENALGADAVAAPQPRAGVAVEVVLPQLPQPLQHRERAVQVADAVVEEAGGAQRGEGGQPVHRRELVVGEEQTLELPALAQPRERRDAVEVEVHFDERAHLGELREVGEAAVAEAEHLEALQRSACRRLGVEAAVLRVVQHQLAHVLGDVLAARLRELRIELALLERPCRRGLGHRRHRSSPASAVHIFTNRRAKPFGKLVINY